MGIARTIRFQGDEVVKRFRHPRILNRRFDRARAAREVRILRRLGEAGVRVPEPLGLERVDGGYEVRMRRMHDVRDLEWCLDHRPPTHRELARLGSDLARIQATGVALLDLHPGNVLLPDDRRLAPIWIDFHAAREDRPQTREAWFRDLVRLASFLVEPSGAEGVATLATGWRHGLDLRHRRAFAFDDAFHARLLKRAQKSRGRWVDEHVDRWRRSSGRLERGTVSGSQALVARHLDHDYRTALLKGEGILACFQDEGLWLDLCRAWEHRIAPFEPLALDAQGRAYVGLRSASHGVPPEDLSRAATRVGRPELWRRLQPLLDQSSPTRSA